MRAFPKLRPVPWDGAVVLAVLALALLAALAPLRRTETAGPLEAVVYVDGQEADRVPLAGPAEQRAYTGNGYTLTVEFSAAGAQVLHSQCPNQVCVHMGLASRSGQIIVCLPAGLVVEIQGGDESGPDAFLG